MSKRFGSRVAVALIAVALVASACGDDDDDTTSADTGGGASSDAPATIKFAFQPASLTACVKVTDERGVFADHGIKMEFPPAPVGPSAGSAQVINGQVDAAATGYANVITAIGSGLPLVLTNGLDEDSEQDGQTGLAVVARKDTGVTTLEGLEGKTVAVSSLSSSFPVLLNEAMEKSGADGSKVKLVEVPFGDQVAAVSSGRVDAVFTIQPFAGVLAGQGHANLGDPQLIAFDKPKVTSSAIYMTKDYVEENADVVERFVAALEEGNEWCNEHPDEMKKAIARLTGAPEAVINQTPVPFYNAGVDEAETEKWGELLVKWKIGDLEEAPSADDILWSGAPRK